MVNRTVWNPKGLGASDRKYTPAFHELSQRPSFSVILPV